MHGDLRGFYGAPVTYAFSMAVGAASSASVLFGHGSVLKLDADAVRSRMQYWRLFSNQLAFHHGLAVSLGLYVIFQFRVLERQMGSRKFGSLTVFVLSIWGALDLALLLSASVQSPGGPYAFLGALSVFFYKSIPRLHPRLYSFLGLHFSDKSSTYLMLLVMLSRDPRTLLSFVPGALIGLLFSSTPVSKLRLPSFVHSLFGLFHPLFEVVPSSVQAQQRQRRVLEAQRRLGLRPNVGGPAGMANGQGFRDQLLPGAGGGMLPPQMAAAPPPPPSEDAIEQLMALGFDRERALVALQSTDNNVEAAANRLLNGL